MERAVAEDAGVVDDSVQRAEFRECSVDDRLRTVLGRDVVVVGQCRPAALTDLVDDGVCHGLPGSRPVACSPEVVDHHAGAFVSREECIFATQSPARAGNDDDSAVQSCHVYSSILSTVFSPGCYICLRRVVRRAFA